MGVVWLGWGSRIGAVGGREKNPRIVIVEPAASSPTSSCRNAFETGAVCIDYKLLITRIVIANSLKCQQLTISAEVSFCILSAES